MDIFLINWRILPEQDHVDAFLKKWKTELRVENADGLIGEFLSQVRDKEFFEYITWQLEESAEGEYREHIRSENFISFVNVGLWRSKDDFFENIGGVIPTDRWFMYPFEAAPRRRAVVTPEAWRIGNCALAPASSSSGTLF